MIGRILGKRYQIVEKVAIGGMSNVYKALDMNLKRYDAVKILKEEFAQNDEFLEQFRQEANSVAGLNHPNIVNIYNVGNEGDLQYIVMEYIKGKTLKKVIKEKGRLFQNQVISYSEQIGRGLQHAHMNGIIHRDIKPQNILITDDGRVKIFDFGIAKHSESSTITNSGRIIGSVHYFSPEQARGLTTDNRSDIYSMGITMYEMVTGRLPFDSESPVTIALKHMQEPVIPPKTVNPGISDKLNAVIMKAIAKDPIDRYQTMDEMLTDIQRIKGPELLVYANAEKTAGPTPKAEMETTQVMAPVRTQSPVTSRSRMSSREDDFDYEYEELEEQEEKEKRRNKGLMAFLLVLILALAGVSLAGIQYLNSLRAKASENDTTRMMPMIDIFGMDEAKARLELSKFQISLELDYVESDKAGGTILSSDPKAGEDIAVGGVVKAEASAHKEQVAVPRFLDMTLEQAEAALKEADLERGNVVEVFDDYILQGMVITSSPASGQQLEMGGKVDFTVSKGKDPEKADLPVPDLQGLTSEKAARALSDMGLKLGTTTRKPTETETLAGKVIGQSLEKGTQVTLGTSVNIELGEYKAPLTRPATKPQTIPSTEPETSPSTEPETSPSTEPVTSPSTEPVTTPSTEPVTSPSTEPESKPADKLTAEMLIGKDFYEAKEIVESSGRKIQILNLYNTNGSKVKKENIQALLKAGEIDGIVEEVALGDTVLVNVMSRVDVDSE